MSLEPTRIPTVAAGTGRSEVESIRHRYACTLIDIVHGRLGVETTPERELRDAVLSSPIAELRRCVEGTVAESFLISPDFLSSVRSMTALGFGAPC